MAKVKSALLVVSLVSVVWSMILLFKVLELVQATELIWFLFGGSIPLAIVLAVLRVLAED